MRLYLLAREFTLYNDYKAIPNLLNNPKLKVIVQIYALLSVYKTIALTLKYVESDENVGDYFSLHPYK